MNSLMERWWHWPLSLVAPGLFPCCSPKSWWCLLSAPWLPWHYRNAKHRITKYKKKDIEGQNIEVVKYRNHKIFMGKTSKVQNIEFQNIKSLTIEYAYYWMGKYGIREIWTEKFRKGKISTIQISKDKISKFKISNAAYQRQNIGSKLTK